MATTCKTTPPFYTLKKFGFIATARRWFNIYKNCSWVKQIFGPFNEFDNKVCIPLTVGRS